MSGSVFAPPSRSDQQKGGWQHGKYDRASQSTDRPHAHYLDHEQDAVDKGKIAGFEQDWTRRALLKPSFIKKIRMLTEQL